MSLLYEGKNLCKFYNNRLALDLPYFRLEKGEALALTGPNGSGKSTLLRLLAFLETPTSGHLRFFAASGFPRRQVTLLLQEPYLFKDSVWRNVTLGLQLRGDRSCLQNAYIEAMQAVGFPDPDVFAARRPNQLSGGEKQRVALASRLALRPLALLLDEPTSSVDRASAQCIARALENFCMSGGSIVCATHDFQLLPVLNGRRLVLDS